MTHPRRIIGAAALVAAALVLGACARPAAPTPTFGPRPGGVITVVLPSEPVSLNGMVVGGERMVTRAIIGQIRWGLLSVRPDYSYEPRLAETVPTLENGLVKKSPFMVTYKLRKQAVWSDGVPVTARDVIFTWRTIMSKKSRSIWRRGYDQIRAISSPDPKTVVIRFKKPYAAYRDLFSVSAYGYVLPAHALAGADFNSIESSGPLAASGPFVLERWDPGSAIVLVRNPKFWGPPAFAERIVFKVAAGERSAEQLFATGAADVYAPEMETGVLDGPLIKRLGAIPDAVVTTAPCAVYEQMTLDMAAGPLRDAKTRRALAAGLDRAAIAAAALGPNGAVAEGVAPRVDASGSAGGGPWSDVGGPARLKKRVRISLLAPDPSETVDLAARERVLAEVTRQLAAHGFEVDAKLASGAELFGLRLPSKKFDTAIWGMLFQPVPDLKHVFHSAAVPPRGQNYARYRDPETDAVLDALDSEVDPAARGRLLDRLEKMLARDLPTIPLFHRATVLISRSHIHPLPPNPTIEGPFGDMAKWWVGT